MIIYAVRIGDRYGIEYEQYLEKMLPYEIRWIREEKDRRIKLQWNKMYAMDSKLDEPICVIDIDILLLNDYKKIFEYPIQKGEFLAAPNWWRGLPKDSIWKINGGFYKYYPTDCQYIYDKFMENPGYWQSKYIADGVTTGPINGEQNFVEESARERLNVITLPDSWFCRMDARKDQMQIIGVLNRMYKEITGNDYMFMSDFHPDIKFVHFTNMDNHPHKWKKYHSYKNLPAMYNDSNGD